MGFEAEGTVGEAAEAVVEKFVNWASKSEVAETDVGEDVAVGSVQAEDKFFAAGFDDVFEHHSVAFFREGLKVFAKVAVVAVGSDGYAPAH